MMNAAVLAVIAMQSAPAQLCSPPTYGSELSGAIGLMELEQESGFARDTTVAALLKHELFQSCEPGADPMVRNRRYLFLSQYAFSKSDEPLETSSILEAVEEIGNAVAESAGLPQRLKCDFATYVCKWEQQDADHLKLAPFAHFYSATEIVEPGFSSEIPTPFLKPRKMDIPHAFEDTHPSNSTHFGPHFGPVLEVPRSRYTLGSFPKGKKWHQRRP